MKGKGGAILAWCAAASIGVFAGSMVAAVRPSSLAFLPGSKGVASSVVGLTDDIRVRVNRYEVAGKTSDVLARIRREYPIGHEEAMVMSGTPSWRFTVPRVRDGQTDLMYPPARELLVIEGEPPIVEVRDFRSPNLVDRFVEWTQHPFANPPRRAS